ncbi:MAG: hypothetical protein HY708_08460 [Ignavibacteriae bacterium]|nr:hypothetical protein [Ignavibacteriota bacterium]
MATILDLIFSSVIGGAILMILLSATDAMNENQSVYNGDMLVQEMLTSTVQLVESEFRNMGFGVPEDQASIIHADSTQIRFLIDLDRDGGFIDTVEYYLGPTSELNKTQNELDRYLHRTVNGGSKAQVGVVVHFNLRYITHAGELLPTPVAEDRLTEIHVVEVTVEVQNPYALYKKASETGIGDRNAWYSSSMWQQTRLASQNSRR